MITDSDRSAALPLGVAKGTAYSIAPRQMVQFLPCTSADHPRIAWQSNTTLDVQTARGTTPIEYGLPS